MGMMPRRRPAQGRADRTEQDLSRRRSRTSSIRTIPRDHRGPKTASHDWITRRRGHPSGTDQKSRWAAAAPGVQQKDDVCTSRRCRRSATSWRHRPRRRGTGHLSARSTRCDPGDYLAVCSQPAPGAGDGRPPAIARSGYRADKHREERDESLARPSGGPASRWMTCIACCTRRTRSARPPAAHAETARLERRQRVQYRLRGRARLGGSWIRSWASSPPRRSAWRTSTSGDRRPPISSAVTDAARPGQLHTGRQGPAGRPSRRARTRNPPSRTPVTRCAPATHRHVPAASRAGAVADRGASLLLRYPKTGLAVVPNVAAALAELPPRWRPPAAAADAGRASRHAGPDYVRFSTPAALLPAPEYSLWRHRTGEAGDLAGSLHGGGLEIVA